MLLKGIESQMENGLKIKKNKVVAHAKYYEILTHWTLTLSNLLLGLVVMTISSDIPSHLATKLGKMYLLISICKLLCKGIKLY